MRAESIRNSIPNLAYLFHLSLTVGMKERIQAQPPAHRAYGPEGEPSFELTPRERLKAQGVGHKAKTIKENLASLHALRLTPYALNLFS